MARGGSVSSSSLASAPKCAVDVRLTHDDWLDVQTMATRLHQASTVWCIEALRLAVEGGPLGPFSGSFTDNSKVRLVVPLALWERFVPLCKAANVAPSAWIRAAIVGRLASVRAGAVS